MIDPKARVPLLQTVQEVARSAAEAAEAQRQHYAYLFGTWKEIRDLRVQVALVRLEEHRLAARRKVLEELDRMNRFH